MRVVLAASVLLLAWSCASCAPERDRPAQHPTNAVTPNGIGVYVPETVTAFAHLAEAFDEIDASGIPQPWIVVLHGEVYFQHLGSWWLGMCDYERQEIHHGVWLDATDPPWLPWIDHEVRHIYFGHCIDYHLSEPACQ